MFYSILNKQSLELAYYIIVIKEKEWREIEWSKNPIQTLRKSIELEGIRDRKLLQTLKKWSYFQIAKYLKMESEFFQQKIKIP